MRLLSKGILGLTSLSSYTYTQLYNHKQWRNYGGGGVRGLPPPPSHDELFLKTRKRRKMEKKEEERWKRT